jgi:hypothetical protein
MYESLEGDERIRGDRENQRGNSYLFLCLDVLIRGETGRLRKERKGQGIMCFENREIQVIRVCFPLRTF